VLWKNRILTTAEHVGGNESRTVRLRLRDGQTTVRVGGRQILL
jgi:hypothetical protein